MFSLRNDQISAAGFEAVRGNAKPKEFNGMIKGPGSGPSSAAILSIDKSLCLFYMSKLVVHGTIRNTCIFKGPLNSLKFYAEFCVVCMYIYGEKVHSFYQIF